MNVNWLVKRASNVLVTACGNIFPPDSYVGVYTCLCKRVVTRQS